MTIVATTIVTWLSTGFTRLVAFSATLVTQFHATVFAHGPLVPGFQVAFFSTAIALDGLTFGADGLVVVVAFFHVRIGFFTDRTGGLSSTFVAEWWFCYGM